MTQASAAVRCLRRRIRRDGLLARTPGARRRHSCARSWTRQARVACSTWAAPPAGMSSTWPEQGFEAVGADPSEAMLAARPRARRRPARARFCPGRLRPAWPTRWAAPASTPCSAWATRCPTRGDRPVCWRRSRDLAAVLRPGGVLVVQQLNYDRILTQGQRFLGLSSGQAGGSEYLFFRFYDYAPGQLTFNMVIMRRDAGRQLAAAGGSDAAAAHPLHATGRVAAPGGFRDAAPLRQSTGGRLMPRSPPTTCCSWRSGALALSQAVSGTGPHWHLFLRFLAAASGLRPRPWLPLLAKEDSPRCRC